MFRPSVRLSTVPSVTQRCRRAARPDTAEPWAVLNHCRQTVGPAAPSTVGDLSCPARPGWPRRRKAWPRGSCGPVHVPRRPTGGVEFTTRDLSRRLARGNSRHFRAGHVTFCLRLMVQFRKVSGAADRLRAACSIGKKACSNGGRGLGWGGWACWQYIDRYMNLSRQSVRTSCAAY